MAVWSDLGGRSCKAVMATTEGVPSASADGTPHGALLDNVSGFTVFAECDLGETFTGTGGFSGFIYDERVGWARDGNIDVVVPSWAAGQRRIILGTFPVSAPGGRAAHVTAGVGVSAGGVTLYYTCYTLFGARS